MRIIILLLSLLLLSGCASSITYEPKLKQTTDIAKVKKDLEFSLFQQVTGKNPISLRITDDFIGIRTVEFQHDFRALDHSSVGYAKEHRIYFESIKECQLYQRKTYYPVFVCDTSENIIYKCFFRTEAYAKMFIDNLWTLKETKTKK